MKRLKINSILLFFVFFLLPGSICVAQTTFNGWFAANNMFRVNQKFSIHLDVQARSTDQLEHLNTFIFRPGLNWHFRKNMIATAGYGFFHSRRSISGISGYAPEHRIWQQFILNHHVGVIPVQHRLRLEQRFISKTRIENGDLKVSGNRFANRVRYFNRAIIPLNGSKPFVNGVFAAIQNELFLNLGDKSVVNGKFFDQNRLYLAIGYRISAKFDLEAGYMNQYVSGSNDNLSRAHIAQLATYLRL
ncbi:MAG: DUF2490 domain-containing protein [Chitinophagaceae bacterium]|nr:MAG: DUF2490 domain-containing protein [Chitinophagaceae bacterium]